MMHYINDFSSLHDDLELECQQVSFAEVYIYKNVIPAVVDTFGVTSDLIICCLTNNRFSKVRQVSKLQIQIEKKWIGYMECLMFLLLSALAHLPLLFQFEVVTVKESFDNQTLTCYKSNFAPVTETSEWSIYMFTFHATMRIMPTLFIISLNLKMYFDIKRLFDDRQKRLEVITRFLFIDFNLWLKKDKHSLNLFPHGIMVPGIHQGQVDKVGLMQKHHHQSL